MALKASVIVPTFRRPGRLTALIGMLADQQLRAEDYEVIVVGDGSPEPAGTGVNSLLGAPGVRVKYLRKANEGPASARAFGARQAEGDHLIFVDDDMVVRRDFIAEHLWAQDRLGPAAINCLFDWEVKAHPASFERWYRQRVDEWMRARLAALSPMGDGLFEIPGVLLTTANLSVRRLDYERVGGFDTGYCFSCEDQDFGLRLEKIGVRGVVTARTRAVHIETHNTLRRVCARQLDGARDTVRFVRRFSSLDAAEPPEIVKANRPLQMGIDPWRLLLKKSFKTVVASDFASPLAFCFVSLCERVVPQLPLLPRAYELLVSAHLQRGWNEGLRIHGAQSAFDAAPREGRATLP